MTRENQSSELQQAVQLLSEHGFEAMANAMRILLNEAMKLERTEYLRDQRYQRTEDRRCPRVLPRVLPFRPEQHRKVFPGFAANNIYRLG